MPAKLCVAANPQTASNTTPAAQPAASAPALVRHERRAPTTKTIATAASEVMTPVREIVSTSAAAPSPSAASS